MSVEQQHSRHSVQIRRQRDGRHARSEPSLATFARQLTGARPGFTLVELLVTIIIIAIIASMVLVGMQAARQAANRANTQALIAKLHSQLMIRLESYRTRRLPINGSVVNWNNPTNLPHPIALTGPQASAVRLNVLRELMRAELPDRYTDLQGALTATTWFAYDMGNRKWIPNPTVGAIPTLQPTATMLSNNRAVLATMTPEFEDAECLYLILHGGLSDSDSIGQHVSEASVGDKDGDGMKEFIDAWGNPIHFLRWAPGFVSDLQPATADPVSHHDPFDPLKLETNAFALTPLIWSDGPDGVSGIQMPAQNASGFFIPSSTNPFTCTVPFPAAMGLPVFTLYIYDPYYAGAPGAQSVGAEDNLTNHLLGQQ